MVPETVWETRQVKTWECVPVTKDVQVTVCKTVEVVEPRTCTHTEYQKVQKTRTCNVKVCKTIQVRDRGPAPTYEKQTVQKQGFRTVCKKVLCHRVQDADPRLRPLGKPVRADRLQDEEDVLRLRNRSDVQDKRCWVSNCVTETVPCTTYKTESHQEPYTYCETICKPITKTENVTVCKTVEVGRAAIETYWECVPVTKTVTNNVKVCKQVQVVENRKCTTYEQS